MRLCKASVIIDDWCQRSYSTSKLQWANSDFLSWKFATPFRNIFKFVSFSSYQVMLDEAGSILNICISFTLHTDKNHFMLIGSHYCTGKKQLQFIFEIAHTWARLLKVLLRNQRFCCKAKYFQYPPCIRLLRIKFPTRSLYFVAKFWMLGIALTARLIISQRVLHVPRYSPALFICLDIERILNRKRSKAMLHKVAWVIYKWCCILFCNKQMYMFKGWTRAQVVQLIF